MIKKILFLIFPWLLLSFSTLFLWRVYKKSIGLEAEKTVITNNIVVQRIEAIGKLELVKFYIKDIVEHTEIKEWWPDPKIVLLASGEAVGCIDLRKIDSNSVELTNEVIRIKLPDPEICYTKINHEESKVYHLENEFFDQPALVDKAYKIAEKQIYTSALRLKILQQTRANAELILKPLLENISGKKVEFVTTPFKQNTPQP